MVVMAFAAGTDSLVAPARGATKAPPSDLDPEVPAREAFKRTALACLAHAQANVGLVQAHGDHEGLHQFRVAFRRLRSLLSLFREVCRDDPEAMAIKARLRAMTVLLGPARDLDVFLEGHPELAEDDRAKVEYHRVAAYAEIEEFLGGPVWPQLLADLDRWLESGAAVLALSTEPGSGHAVVVRALSRRRARIIHGGADLTSLTAEERHRVRIEAKKLRYGCQFFGSMWPGDADRVATLEKRLGRLQDSLGSLNDRATWEQLRVRCGLEHVEPPEVDEDGLLCEAQDYVARIEHSRPFWVPRPPALSPFEAVRRWAEPVARAGAVAVRVGSAAAQLGGGAARSLVGAFRRFVGGRG